MSTNTSLFSGISATETVYSENPQVLIAIEAINLIHNIKEFEPIFLALENKLGPKMEIEVQNLGYTKSSDFLQPCATCHTKKGL